MPGIDRHRAREFAHVSTETICNAIITQRGVHSRVISNPVAKENFFFPTRTT